MPVTTTVVTNPTFDLTAPVAEPVAEPTPETPETEPVKAEPVKIEEDPKFAAKFAALSKKERAIVAKEQAVKAQEKQYQEYQEAVKLAKDNPEKFIQLAGFKDVQDFLENIVNGPEKQQIDPIKELERKQNEFIKQQQEARSQEVYNDLLLEVSELVDKNSETYELIKEYNREAEVIQIMQMSYQSSNGEEVLSPQQAADRLEEWLENQAREQLQKFNQLKKLQAKKQETATLEVTKPEDNTQPVKRKVTLTNNLVSSPNPSGEKRLSREESLKEAAKLIKWE